jgi:outer membrane protein OmpA-like peptidoglycan-associated protein
MIFKSTRERKSSISVALGASLLPFSLVLGLVLTPSPVSAITGNPVTINLGTAETYSAIIGGASLTNTGATTLNGTLGFNPTGVITNTGTLNYSTINNGNAAAVQAYTDMGTAYNDALGRPSTPNSFPATGGGTYIAGVYNQGAASAPSGTLTLNGQNDPNSVFIFQIGGAFAPSGEMLLTNGAQAGNVFWQVAGAVAPTAGSKTVGTIMAQGAFSLGAGAILNGRVLVTGAGTFSANSVTTTSPVTNPGAPTAVSASPGDGLASISFTPPTNTGRTTITGFTVTSTPGGLTATGSASPLTLSGLTNGTGYTFTVTARNSVGSSLASSTSNLVYPEAAPTPTPPPTPTPTPTGTPTPTPTPTPTGTPTPASTGTSPPSSPVYDLLVAARRPQRASTVFLGGEPMAAVFTINQVNGTVTMSGDGLEIKVGSPTTQSPKKALDSSGTPNLIDGGSLVSSCSGFLPGAELTYFLVNTKMAVSLGKLPVSRKGTCSGKVSLPDYLIKGVYTLQMEGLVDRARQRSATSQMLSTSIRVNVIKSAGKHAAKPDSKPASKPLRKPEAEPTNRQGAQNQRIQFEPYSATLTKAAKQQLHALVKKLPNKTHNFVRIVGFVSAGGSPSHANQLGNTRSRTVARYLRSQGVHGTYVLKLGGNTVSNSQLAPHARVTIYPNQ